MKIASPDEVVAEAAPARYRVWQDEHHAETLAMYGPDVQKPGTYAASCLLARRLAERGVRFIQLYMRGWDQHGNLPEEIRKQCLAVDQPQAALIQDLKQRGMLEDTLVVWTGEFGRTPKDGERGAPAAAAGERGE